MQKSILTNCIYDKTNRFLMRRAVESIDGCKTLNYIHKIPTAVSCRNGSLHDWIRFTPWNRLIGTTFLVWLDRSERRALSLRATNAIKANPNPTREMFADAVSMHINYSEVLSEHAKETYKPTNPLNESSKENQRQEEELMASVDRDILGENPLLQPPMPTFDKMPPKMKE